MPFSNCTGQKQQPWTVRGQGKASDIDQLTFSLDSVKKKYLLFYVVLEYNYLGDLQRTGLSV